VIECGITRGQHHPLDPTGIAHAGLEHHLLLHHFFELQLGIGEQVGDVFQQLLGFILLPQLVQMVPELFGTAELEWKMGDVFEVAIVGWTALGAGKDLKGFFDLVPNGIALFGRVKAINSDGIGLEGTAHEAIGPLDLLFGGRGIDVEDFVVVLIDELHSSIGLYASRNPGAAV
jgi:hypothetical protein